MTSLWCFFINPDDGGGGGGGGVGCDGGDDDDGDDDDDDLGLVPAWMCNYIHCTVWDEITYSFPNFNGFTVEILVWISNFILNLSAHVISYACWD